MTEDELNKAAAALTDKAMAAIEDAKEAILKHAKTVEDEGQSIGLCVIATCHVFADMVSACLAIDKNTGKRDRKVMKAAANQIEKNVLPALESLAEAVTMEGDGDDAGD